MKPAKVFYFICVLFAVLWTHLFRMQVLDYAKYKARSERNRIRPMLLEAPRGVVLDRDGRELISNRLAFDCYIIPQEAKANLEKTFRILAPILGNTEAQLAERYRESKKSSFTPVSMAEDISKEVAMRVEEETDAMPGIFVKTRPVRRYNIGPSAAHVLGYIGAISAEEYRALKNDGYRLADLIGKAGLEKSYETELRGKSGAVQYEVDSRGRLLRILSIQEPEEGRTIQTTLDSGLQATVSRLLETQTGAVAVIDLLDGGVLCLASSPTFDPNIFVSASRPKGALQQILTGRGRPLINRVIAGEYPPGSTFKIITAHAGLRRGKIDAHTTYVCPGYFMIGKHVFKCWRHEGHGPQNVVEALAHSCDTFFYNTGLRLDVNPLAEDSREYGLGVKTRIDLPGERTGNVPTREWKKNYFKNSGTWYKGETVIFAIGQGYLTLTPLQILRACAVIGTGGKLWEPRIASHVGGVSLGRKPPKNIPITDEHLALIREGMRRVVQSPTGTAQRAQRPNVKIAGKTGTAQTSQGEDHAWFIGYAPSDVPRAAIVVLLEHGGHGGLSAAAIAGDTFSWMADNGYFK